MKSEHEFTKSDIWRPPDWRWRRAQTLKDNSELPRTDDNDDYVLLAIDYMRGKQTSEQRTAESIYSKEVLASVKWEIEARIIAGQSDNDIASRLSASSDVVRFYEAWFYNIRDRLNNHSYIFQRLIYPIIEVIDGKPSREAIWKFFAFCGGKEVIDEVIYDASIMSGVSSKDFWKICLKQTALRRLAVKVAFSDRLVETNAEKFLSAVSDDAKRPEIDNLHKVLADSISRLGWNWGDKKLLESAKLVPNFEILTPESKNGS